MSQIDDRPGAITRRGMLSGVGAAFLGTSLVEGGARASAAVPSGDGVAARQHGRVHGESSPYTTTIASAPTSAYIYKFVSMYDFEPFDPAGNRTWGGFGVYSAGTATPLRATLDIPPGCLVREVEYYMYNNSGNSTEADSYIWVPGSGVIWSIGATISVPSTSTSSVSALRTSVTQQGPYPYGSRLLVSASTPTDGSVQINGARAAFTGAAAGVGTRGAPSRVFDAQIGTNTTRTITLPATLIAPGVVGVIAAVSASGSGGQGALTVFRADQGRPAQATMHYGTAATTSEITSQLSAARQIKVHTTRAVHVAIDVIGILG